MDINLTLIFQLGTTSDFSCSSQNGFDHLFPQNEQGSHFPQTFGHRFIAARVFDFTHKVFSAQFLKIIGSLARGVIAGNVYLDFGSQICTLEPLWSGGQGNHGLHLRQNAF